MSAAGCHCFDFLLEGTIEKHLDDCKEEFSREVEEIKRSKYVDDVFLGGETTEEVQHLKQTSVEIFSRASFTLHKWHSNRKELVKEELDDLESEESFAKQQLKSKESGTKLLGLGWNESEDTISISFEKKDSEPTKRGVLQTLASIYDPLGIVSPVTLMGKIIFRDICDQHLKWDSELPENLRERWRRFVKNLPDKIEVPRSISKEGEIQGIDLHAFGDASGNGVSTAIYTTVTQDSGTSQGLLTAKARLAKKGLTTPRLELVAAHMTANVVDNVKTTLKGYPVKKVYGWLDSSVALYWIKGENQYKQFVTNRVSKIKEKEFIEWRHVPSELNPSDIGSRGCYSKKLDSLWFNGPSWLQTPDEWPPKIMLESSDQSEAEAKPIKSVFKMRVEINEEKGDKLDEILEKFQFQKVMKVTAWVMRFIENCRSGKREYINGPLTTQEINDHAVLFWIKRVQSRHENTEKFKDDQQQLGLQKNANGVYVCHGRIQGEYPVYLPPSALFSERLVMNAHLSTLDGE